MQNRVNELSKEDRHKMLANAKASLEIDGLIVTDNESKILEDYIDGLITEADFLKILNSKSSVNERK